MIQNARRSNEQKMINPIPDIEDLEVKLLLDAIYERYGYDFRLYSRAHLKRQLLEFAKAESIPTLSAVQ